MDGLSLSLSLSFLSLSLARTIVTDGSRDDGDGDDGNDGDDGDVDNILSIFLCPLYLSLIHIYTHTTLRIN